ncbi:hypothetical protein PN294_11150 [Romboutsia sp. 1001216sp1]|uniref:helix-turn-helix domain-containing protein n=1 Tax=unclassified Romboutsia TaxID=2626894 RepID=UPI00189E13FB|nr:MULTISPECIES: helix-turn-helix domain-containing protein [unclassified Romboutsia]MDB8802749.1 hypothetical protein [Romboutsia sp. 1001216sp1]MDB8814146.1 hypothetical protein [Romboutsia sp. 1001216sp1]
MSICSKLNDYIKENNISKEDVSKLTGISLKCLDLSLDGKRTLSFEEFEKILIVIGEKADTFIELKSNDSKKRGDL